MAGYIGQLLMPDMYGSFQQGVKDGQAQRKQRTLAQYMQGAVGGDPSALAQVYGADPESGITAQKTAQALQ